MLKTKHTRVSIVFPVLICSALLFGSISVWIGAFDALKDVLIGVFTGRLQPQQLSSAMENQVSQNLAKNDIWIDIYGGFQALLGKHELNHFDIIKDNNGSLYRQYESLRGEEKTKAIAQSIVKISELGATNNAYVLYVQCPYKNHERIPDLAGYAESFFEKNQNALLGKLSGQIPILDLREPLQACNPVHYRTDHHWTSEAAFLASQLVLKALTNEGRLTGNRSEVLLDSNNFIRQRFPSSFQGSIGIRTGNLFARKDDFSIFTPVFPTSFSYEHLNSEGVTTMQKSGCFEEALLNLKLLYDNRYKNKYGAFLFGSSGNVVRNNIVNNDEPTGRLLVISHSYARAMVPYLALAFHKTVYVDPQRGRYDGNYNTLIESFRPDIILIMHNDAIRPSLM